MIYNAPQGVALYQREMLRLFTPTEFITCKNVLTYEEILNWRGFSFETSRIETTREQRKAYAASVDNGTEDNGRYGIAESERIIANVVSKTKGY
jgi:hypothetical protein